MRLVEPKGGLCEPWGPRDHDVIPEKDQSVKTSATVLIEQLQGSGPCELWPRPVYSPPVSGL